jgi:hypothetical protein
MVGISEWTRAIRSSPAIGVSVSLGEDQRRNTSLALDSVLGVYPAAGDPNPASS